MRAAGRKSDDLADPKVREAFRKRLAAFTAKATGSAGRVERILLLAEPPSLDAGEITDKGRSISARCCSSRAEAVAALYDPQSELTINGGRQARYAVAPASTVSTDPVTFRPPSPISSAASAATSSGSTIRLSALRATTRSRCAASRP